MNHVIFFHKRFLARNFFLFSPSFPVTIHLPSYTELSDNPEPPPLLTLLTLSVLSISVLSISPPLSFPLNLKKNITGVSKVKRLSILVVS